MANFPLADFDYYDFFIRYGERNHDYNGFNEISILMLLWKPGSAVKNTEGTEKEN